MGGSLFSIVSLALFLMAAGETWGQGDYALARQAMLADIVVLFRQTREETGRADVGEGIMAAMAKVPRHRFVPPNSERHAYENRPLPIGHGQTISQPFIVALMTDLLDLKPTDKVLEIGTGCGYQAAVLAELAAAVYTIEIVAPLAREASERLTRLGYRNVTVRVGDGYQGWSEHAPFDAIMVTAAAPQIPPALVTQLKPGGKMVIPVGAQSGAQSLLVLEKDNAGKTTTRKVLDVRFVPLTREKP